MFTRVLALTTFALLGAHIAHGQGAWNLPAVTDADIAPGAWREYRFSSRALPSPQTLRIVFLEQETRDGERYQWVENIADDDLAGLDPGKYWRITRTLESLDDPLRPPLERIFQDTYTATLTQRLPNRTHTRNAVTLQPLGWDDVATEGGVFRARVVERTRFDLHETLHYSAENPVGLVLAQAPGMRMELTAWGDGATSGMVAAPQQPEANETAGLSQLLTSVRSTGSRTADTGFHTCVREYAFAWMLAGDVTDVAQTLEQAKPYCISLGLDDANATQEYMDELLRLLQTLPIAR